MGGWRLGGACGFVSPNFILYLVTCCLITPYFLAVLLFIALLVL